MSLEDAIKSSNPFEQLRLLGEIATRKSRAGDQKDKLDAALVRVEQDHNNIVYYVQSGMGALPVRKI